MYIFMAKSEVALEDLDVFERDQKERSAQLLKAKGFIQRMVLKDKDRPGIYFYISAWESVEDHRGFKVDPDVKAWEGGLKAKGANFAELERADCAIVVQDRAEGQA